jgi:hypothetical protein
MKSGDRVPHSAALYAGYSLGGHRVSFLTDQSVRDFVRAYWCTSARPVRSDASRLVKPANDEGEISHACASYVLCVAGTGLMSKP